MSHSPMTDYVRLSPNRNASRKQPIRKITIHHMAGNLTVEQCGALFARPERRASSNYGIGSDGRVGCYVEEEDRSWCSSSPDNDHQAVTIEVANNQIGGQWTVSDKALQTTIDLCVDICQRNDIKELGYTGDKNGNLTMHCWFASTACPGPYLKSKFLYIASEVNKRLTGGEYRTENDGGGIKAPEGTLYTVQLGAFSIKKNCTNYVATLKAKGVTAFATKQGIYWRAQCGAFSHKENAEEYAATLRKKGLQAIVLLKSVK